MAAQLLTACHFTLLTLMVLLFIQAALHKAGDLRRFSGYLADYHPALRSPSMPLAALLLAAEAAATLLTLLPATSRIGQAALLALLTLYTAALALRLASGKGAIECGCGGAPVQVSPRTLARNLCLLALAALMAALPASGLDRAVLGVAILAGFTLWLGYQLVEQLLRNSDLKQRIQESL